MCLGFNVNEKSEQTPRQSIIYLVLNFQTLSLALPPAQVAKVVAQCDRLVASETLICRQLEAVVGLISFAGSMLHLGRLFITPIIWMNSTTTSRRDFRNPVTSSLKRGLAPLQRCQVFNETDIFSSASSVPSHFNGRLRLRLEWSDWPTQGARFLDF